MDTANLAQSPHNISYLAHRNFPIPPLVIQQECLLKLSNLVLIELARHDPLLKSVRDNTADLFMFIL